MTTIFYDGKNLHADRRIVHECFPMMATNDGIKLFRNPENTIAIGVCGETPDKKLQKRIFGVSNIIFKGIYNEKFKEQITLKEDDNKYEINDFNIQFIAITKNRAFLYKEEVLFPQTGFIGALGTGARSIIAAYYVVKDVAIAFKISAEIDHLSSTEYMSIMADSLNSFVVE